MKIYSYCSTTHNCESLFSNMAHLKLNYRNKFTDAYLDNGLRADNTNYTRDYNKLVEEYLLILVNMFRY